jgi:predicted double-glycine peptidase
MACFAGPASAGSVQVPVILGGPAHLNVVSIKEARFQTVIKQQFDFSCGSAALATLLTYHYEHPVDEMAVFTAMYERGDQARIRRSGFSLLDMKIYLENHGFRADGFELDLDRLHKASVPAIVLINTNGYRHFVLIKGIEGNEVVVGDPALGVRVIDRATFETMWNGVAFVVRNNAGMGRKYFNQDKDWKVRVKAPFGSALSRQSLSNFTVHLTSTVNSF